MKPPIRLRFQLGGFEAEGVELWLSRGQLLYRKTVGPIPAQAPDLITPSEQQWLQFWHEVDRLGVWSWSPEYFDPTVLDGLQWSLSLRYGPRQVKCKGSNAYPDSVGDDYSANTSFGRFLTALSQLAGGRPVT